MSGRDNVLVDTNIVIYGVGGNYKIRSLLEGKTLFISVITEMELLGNPFKTEREKYLIRDFISNCFSLNIDSEIKEKTIAIRKKLRIRLPDAIIAATSIVHKLPLITVDRDFGKLLIPNLQIVSL